MQDAKYFIEVWKNKDSPKLINGPIQAIDKLKFALKNTLISKDLKTIAIWYIKPKNEETSDSAAAHFPGANMVHKDGLSVL